MTSIQIRTWSDNNCNLTSQSLHHLLIWLILFIFITYLIVFFLNKNTLFRVFLELFNSGFFNKKLLFTDFFSFPCFDWEMVYNNNAILINLELPQLGLDERKDKKNL